MTVEIREIEGVEPSESASFFQEIEARKKRATYLRLYSVSNLVYMRNAEMSDHAQSKGKEQDYIVNLKDQTCSCVDFRRNGKRFTCKHIHAAITNAEKNQH